MYKIACQDMGMACPFVAEDGTLEGAMAKLNDHGAHVHPAEIQKMMDEVMTEAMMMEKMKSVAKQV